ncbi:MAG: recombinase family protein [Clostridia bacterium]|nr:recombinase family protein [Clostridia bacterium]
MKTAVIYARYSSDSQTEQSIEGQLRVCNEYANRNGIAVLNTYIDRAMTGTNDNRPDFQQMIKDSASNNWQYVIVYKIDRFSRNKYENAKYKKILKDNGVKLLSAMENIPDTPEGIILESLLEGMAEYYSAELSQKVKRGMHETRLKGHFTGGSLPYGYKLDGRKIVIDETKIEIVQYMFNQYAKGKFVRNIIEDLNSKNIYNNGKPFAKNTIYNMLRNERYTGTYEKDGLKYENTYPQIIDKDTFEKVKSKRKINHYGKNSVKTVYLLKNKLVCGYCGKPISAESGTTKLGKTIHYYKCLGIKKYRNGCIKETIRQEVLEEFVLNVIITELSKPPIMNKIVKQLLDIQKSPNHNSTITMLEKSKHQAEVALSNILKAVEQGIINNTTNNRMHELEKQLEEIDKQLLIEKCKSEIKISEKTIREFYKEALLLEPQLLIDTVIHQITCFNDRLEITFNTPTIKSPDTNQGSFLTLKTKMKSLIQNRTILKDMIVKFYI